MKTAVTVLQEMMVKMTQTPDYECISQSGPEHQAMFEYRCAALGAVVTAQARSKKEAKQEAARLMLRALAARGHLIPPPYGLHDVSHSGLASGVTETTAMTSTGETSVGGGSRSYVALLKELCTEYKLPGAEYELVGDTGPPHMRHFTMAARVGQRQRLATATTKKAARQLAAEQLYTYLRENLARLTADFVEEDALVRAHEKAMERYLETREDTRRPDLGQKIADYHLGLVNHIDADRCEESLRMLESGTGDGVEELESALSTLGLSVQASTLARTDGGDLHVLTVDANPQMSFAGTSPQRARVAALRYLRRALKQHPSATDVRPPTG
ncbi:unnamed protein product [Diatraea saccharalis]|uniref:DRBM domain-containing protein n=1 Tax=Diatraea saccharalis TaxID=40085 RepID=A0A9N9R9K0_9NEOP|nr:unnamed protein product [Diatraea saccharalis]